jgi:hypothetical protein
VCPEDPILKVLERSEFSVVDNVLATFTVLPEITVPVDVAPEFVIRDAELD